MNDGVHKAHCSIEDGCKYGDSDCPVINRKEPNMSQENMAREAMTKYAKGKGMTDEELAAVLKFFEKAEGVLEELTRHFNPSYGFAFHDARINCERLKCFDRVRKEARKEDRKNLL